MGARIAAVAVFWMVWWIPSIMFPIPVLFPVGIMLTLMLLGIGGGDD